MNVTKRILGLILIVLIGFNSPLNAIYENESAYYMVISGPAEVLLNSSHPYELRVFNDNDQMIKESTFSKTFTKLGASLLEKKATVTDAAGKSLTLAGSLQVEVMASLAKPEGLDIVFTNPVNNDAATPTRIIQEINAAKSSVEMAAYTIANQDIVNALVAAADRLGPGNVKLVVEKSYYDKPDYKKYFDALEAAGIKIVKDTTDGLMHNKFVVTDQKKVITGSANFTNNGFYDDNNNTLSFNSAEISAAYHQEFSEMFDQGKFGKNKTPSTNNQYTVTVGDPNSVNINTADAATLAALPGIGATTAQAIVDYRKANGKFAAAENLMDVPGIGSKTFGKIKAMVSVSAVATREVPVEVYFAPTDDYKGQMLKLINAATTSIDFAVFTFTDYEIREALIAAHQRGVKVTGIFDAWQSDNPASAYAKMKELGMDVYRDTNNGLMHNKFMVIDNSSTLTGSYNWTYSAENKNDENGIIIRDAQIAGQYASEIKNIL